MTLLKQTADAPVKPGHPLSFGGKSEGADCTNLDMESIQPLLYKDNGRNRGFYNGSLLESKFQPIYSLAHKRIIGYEALVRGKRIGDGGPMDLERLFSPDRDEAELVLTDRLCRVLHVKNFSETGEEGCWLFLNICPTVMMNGKRYGSFFSELLKRYKLPPHRVVVEIVEHPIMDGGLLVETVRYYKEMGCLIAMDDFGTGYSNFERIWLLGPHIIKLDRSIIQRAGKSKKVRGLLSGMVKLLHQAGSLALMEGIETEEEALISMDCGVDFVQGFYFGKPSYELKEGSNCFKFDDLIEKYKGMAGIKLHRMEKKHLFYRRIFKGATDGITAGEPLSVACSEMIGRKEVLRCYLLDEDGVQMGETLFSPINMEKEDIRFRPLKDGNSADWFRRRYYRRAAVHPGEMQVSEPYLSITGLHMCVTLSLKFDSPKGWRTLCCDLNWD